jgi:hypothetical protein
MVISHTGSQSFRPDWNYLAERTGGFSKLRNVITGAVLPLDDFEIKPKESFVFELLK